MAMPRPISDPVGDAAEEHGGAHPDARQVRALKIVVIVLGALLIIGFAVVIGRIAWLATQPGGATAPARNAPTFSIALPAGAVIRQTTVSGDRMTVQFESPQQTGIIVLNLTTGHVLSRVEFYPEAPRQ
jgi:hypothetical protein